MSHRFSFLFSFALLLALPASTADAQGLIRATLLLQEGDVPIGGDGSAVLTLDNPYTTPAGSVGLAGRLASGDHFVWINGTVVWLGSDGFPNALSLSTSQSDTMGFTDGGNFAYGPTVDSEPSVWSHLGLVARETEIAPGFGPLDTYNFIYDPAMTASGVAYFVASIQFDGTSSSSDARALYISADGSAGAVAPVLRSGDVVMDSGGAPFTIEGSSTGIDTDFHFSSNGAHYIAVVDLATGSTLTDGGLVVDGALVAQESVTDDGAGGSMNFFDEVAVNATGDYVFSGDSDGASTSDEFIAYNGEVMVREGATLGSVTLGSTATVQALSISDSGSVAHHWLYNGGEALFYAPSAATMDTGSLPVLVRGDRVDLDADGVADATVTDLNGFQAAGSGLNLADDGLIVVWVDLDYDGDGIGETEAIIRFEPAACGDGVVQDGEACDEGGSESATCNANCTLARCGDGIVNAAALETCDESGVETADCDLDCTAPACGDAVHNATAGEACDDGGESATCNMDCTLAACGDLTVNVTAGEDCDEGGELSGTCDSDCTAPICGDGFHNPYSSEFCDEGGESAMCDVDCSPVYCGDGVANASAGETCDEAGEAGDCDIDCTAAECGDGVLNVTAGEECDASGESATCNADCSLARCGDSVINASAGEACDAGGQSAACDADCTAVVCGDGVLNTDAGEACEDGNMVDGDGCEADCTLTTGSFCGDGVVDEGEACDAAGGSADCDADCTAVVCGDGVLNTDAGEACEDGNMVDGDGCEADCTLTTGSFCGDGVVDEGEACDAAGSSAECDADCTAVVCGDGVLNTDAGEACEDGNMVDGDGCEADCTLTTGAFCGDGVVDEGEACDAAGGSAECDADCTAVVCGDGVLNQAAGERCEDGNTEDGDGCSSGCEVETSGSTAGGCSIGGGPSSGDRGPGLTLLGVLALVLRRRRSGARP